MTVDASVADSDSRSIDLVATDRQRLGELEDVVERGLRTIRRAYREVGFALGEIRDSRAYRATHSTFDGYCRDRWGIGRNYADKLIRAAAYADEVGTTVPTERAARALLAGEAVLTGEKPKPTRNAANEALRAIEGRSNATGPSAEAQKIFDRLRKANEVAWYYESFGSDPHGSVFHAERAARQLRRLAAKGIKLTDDQADRVAAALRDAASALEGVRPEGPPA